MNRAGLTLVELMVAIALAGLGMTVGYASYAQLTALDKRNAAAERRLQRESAVRAAIVHWLSNARPDSLADTWRITPGQSAGVNDDRVSFDVDFAAPLSAEPVAVTLYIDRDPETPQRGLVAALDRHNSVQQITELCAEAEEMTVEYFLATREQQLWAQHRTVELRAASERAVRIQLRGSGLSALMTIPLTAVRVI